MITNYVSYCPAEVGHLVFFSFVFSLSCSLFSCLLAFKEGKVKGGLEVFMLLLVPYKRGPLP